MRKFAHLVNPIVAPTTSDLSFAQPVTFETLRCARDFARGQVEVRLLTAQYPEDRPALPEGFTATPDLTRSVLDGHTFQIPRKLPYLADLLDRLRGAGDADYLIFTNVDIGLMPYFYLAVDQIVEEGLDAFVINRRTISDTHRNVADLPLIYSEIGEPHEGHDCFVFRTEAYERYKLAQNFIGVPFYGRALLWNLVCYSSRFREFRHRHLTFHLGPGNTQRVGAPEYEEYRAVNRAELVRVLEQLEDDLGPYRRNRRLAPYVEEVLCAIGGRWPAEARRPSLLRRVARRMRRLVSPHHDDPGKG